MTRILDAGCGPGQLGRTFLSIYPQAELVGVDRDPAVLATAQQAVTMGVRRASYIEGDIERGLPPGPFDLAFASVVLIVKGNCRLRINGNTTLHSF